MKKERNQKNVITLYGQVLSFLVETAFNIYMLIHFSNLSMFEASFMPISQVVASTIISVIQLVTSHEMRRFLKNQFNLYWIFFDFFVALKLSMSIYDLVLLNLCHFHHHQPLIVTQITQRSRYLCFYLGSPSIQEFSKLIFVIRIFSLNIVFKTYTQLPSA